MRREDFIERAQALVPALRDRAAEADVRVHFTDGWTGRELEGHRAVKLIPATD